MQLKSILTCSQCGAEVRVSWMKWIDLFALALAWSCPMLLYWTFGPRTWTALRTGRWAAWPRIYDSRTSPCFFRYAIVASIAMFSIFLFLAVLLTMGCIDQLLS